MSSEINIGFVPLTDAAPLIVAVELGFAQEEGLKINLNREFNWSTVRDKLSFGLFDGAQVLSPLANALTLGVGAVQCPISIPMVMNMNGNAFVASHALADRLAEAGSKFGDARSFGEAVILLAEKEVIRVAVPFMDSMHVTMLRYLVERLGGTPEKVFDFHVSSPATIEEGVSSGDVDAFMVGAPWWTKAVENGSGRLVLTSNAIWQGAPEKVLGLRDDWLRESEKSATRLTRAIYRAGNWVSDRANASVASEILAKPRYLDMDAATIEFNLRNSVVVNAEGSTIIDAMALQLDAKRIGFPWQSSIGWIAKQNAARWGVDPKEAYRMGAAQCRGDIYGKAVESISGPIPRASAKVEGSLTQVTPAPGLNNPILGPDAFFDGAIFDPA